ncbi:MAG: DUF5906 domain-containing protein [Clostridia bacterium]
MYINEESMRKAALKNGTSNEKNGKIENIALSKSTEIVFKGELSENTKKELLGKGVSNRAKPKINHDLSKSSEIVLKHQLTDELKNQLLYNKTNDNTSNNVQLERNKPSTISLKYDLNKTINDAISSGQRNRIDLPLSKSCELQFLRTEPNTIKALLRRPKEKKSIREPSELLKNRRNFDIVKLSQYILGNHHFIYHANKLYVYDDCFYKELDKHDLQVLVQRTLEAVALEHNTLETIADILTHREYKEIYELVKINPDIQMNKIDKPFGLINFKNGVYDVRKRILKAHSPSYYFFHCINQDYCDNSFIKGDVFERFIQVASNGDEMVRTQVLELIGLLLYRYPIKSFFVLLGNSGSGKSQLGRFIISLLGENNVTTVPSMAKICERFALAEAKDKTLIACMDLPYGPLSENAISTIKQLVGSDPITIEAKYAQPFTLYDKPILLCAGNYAIRYADMQGDYAFLSRMQIIPLNGIPAEHERIPELHEKLLEEAPYIIKEALYAFEDLEARGFNLTKSYVPEEFQVRTSRTGYSDVENFVLECLAEDEKSEISVSKLREAYLNCSSVHLSKEEFGRLFKQCISSHFPSAISIKRTLGTDNRGYKGISLVSQS